MPAMPFRGRVVERPFPVALPRCDNNDEHDINFAPRRRSVLLRSAACAADGGGAGVRG